jgi:hypothetical protein
MTLVPIAKLELTRGGAALAAAVDTRNHDRIL